MGLRVVDRRNLLTQTVTPGAMKDYNPPMMGRVILTAIILIAASGPGAMPAAGDEDDTVFAEFEPVPKRRKAFAN